jgi:VWFA-related protein
MPDKMRRVVVFLCAAGLLAAQDPPPKDQAPEPAPPSIGSVTVRNVLAPVTVEDHNHDFVPGLTPYDFRLYDNGKLQNITQDMATHPLSVVVVIQANADVEKILPYIKRLSSVFESLVLGEEGEMAVIGFDHRVKVLTDFTSDPAKIDSAFQALSVGSYTGALNDATMRAIGLLKSRPTNRRRVVIQIAENRDKGSEIKSVREILTEAEFANVVFYPIDISQLLAALTSQAQPNRPSTIPPGGEHLPMGTVNTGTTAMQSEMGNWVPALKDIFDAAKGIFVPDPLDVYAKYSGGRQYGFKNEKELQRDVMQIGNELHSQYLLSYSPNNQNEAGFHQIRVVVVKADIKAVRVRDGYWMAAQPK